MRSRKNQNGASAEMRESLFVMLGGGEIPFGIWRPSTERIRQNSKPTCGSYREDEGFSRTKHTFSQRCLPRKSCRKRTNGIRGGNSHTGGGGGKPNLQEYMPVTGSKWNKNRGKICEASASHSDSVRQLDVVAWGKGRNGVSTISWNEPTQTRENRRVKTKRNVNEKKGKGGAVGGASNL